MCKRMNPTMTDRSELKMNRWSNQHKRIQFGLATVLGMVNVDV
ncbi:hypothetical protein HPL003_13755 [Paenibacillus terrae HPL-003]|uniref:Uncharacterized protein n=1 Tax=Paenibacillus terrae (strain HPL-003) TaxID=985665 RepID=G7VYW2_PAETH|nr:hypothetical protein [Paenibacillus terrae]AET59502.1 hypothetical protein HPL003_13755 [Paenibacillus terrae HPL-003]